MEMKAVSRRRLTPGWKYIAWAVITLLVAAHLSPYVSSFRIPHFDFYNVMSVINYLQSPHLFGDDLLLRIQTNYQVNPAPVYFYGLCYPLSFILPAKWVLLTIGFVITCLCVYFAGSPWTHQKAILTASILALILLHVYVTPLEGNRRSFTPVLLLGALWLNEDPDYLWMLLLTALGAGIYPPAVLIVMTYFGLLELEAIGRRKRTLSRVFLRLIGLLCVFLVVLLPFLLQSIVSSNELIAYNIPPLQYDFSSVQGIVTTFFFGTKNIDRGALIRKPGDLKIFGMLVILASLQLTILKNRFELLPRYVRLLAASMLLWGLAHLTHPLIYQPVKYTRVSLVLVVALLVADNLPRTCEVLKKQFSGDALLRYLLYGLSLWQLSLLGLFGLGYLPYSKLITLTGVPGFWWEFFFVLPFFLSILIAFPSHEELIVPQSFVGVAVFFGVLFVPHATEPPQFFMSEDVERTRALKVDEAVYRSLYPYLEETPPGTKIAGPPYLTIGIPAVARRSVYTHTIKARDFSGLACLRQKKFWSIYFSSDPEAILTFMRKNEIDLLLVDKKYFTERHIIADPGCVGSLGNVRDSVLNRNFRDATWRWKNRFYLIDRKTVARLTGSLVLEST